MQNTARLSKNRERVQTTASFVGLCFVLKVAKDAVGRASNLAETESYSERNWRGVNEGRSRGLMELWMREGSRLFKARGK